MKEEERLQAKLYTEYVKQRRKYFEYADTAQNLLEQQKDDDLLLVQNWLMEVHNKLKQDDKRKRELVLLIQGVWRIEKYCGGLETVAKASTVRVVEHSKEIEQLKSEKRILELELSRTNAKHEKQISILEKEIEFLTKNS